MWRPQIEKRFCLGKKVWPSSSERRYVYESDFVKWENQVSFLFFISLFFNSFIYLVIFGCTVSLLLWGFSPVVASEDYSLVVEHGFLIAVASLVADHEL